MAGTKVLLVDDEVEFTEALAERLTSRGLTVDTSDNGASALQKVETATYDAIVLDLAMPGMDGIETLRRMLTRQPELQVILLTGHGTVRKGVEAIREGAVEFLEKPADVEKLVAMIKEARSQRVVLYEQRIGDSLKDILRKKGW